MTEHGSRAISLHRKHFGELFGQLSEKSKSKVLWTIKLIETQQKIPSEYLKHITGTDGLYEIRIQSEGLAIRFFCFFGKNNIIIVINGFIKKTNKTPEKEIKKAIRIKKETEKTDLS